jgi:hypothetical protein
VYSHGEWHNRLFVLVFELLVFDAARLFVDCAEGAVCTVFLLLCDALF